MKKVTQRALTKLINQKRGPKVTLYMPTHRSSSPAHMSEDEIRFKNLVNQVAQILGARDAHEKTHPKIIAQLEALVHDQTFWRDQAEGLAICVNPTTLTYFNLPIASDEYVAVDTHYHLAPLFGLAQENQQFYVLALARQNPALFIGDLYELSPCDVELPKDPETALRIDELAQDRNRYAIQGQRMAATGTIVHGRGGGEKEMHHQMRAHFFRLINQKLAHKIDTTLPLIMAGTSDDVVEFRQLSSLKHITAGMVEGNRTDDDLPRLHRAALRIMHDYIAAGKTALLQKFQELTGAGRALYEPVALRDAAEKGRIGTLLLGLKTVTSDTVRDDLQAVSKLVFPSEHHRSLLDEIALLTWHSGGQIHNCDKAKMPETSMMAGLLRY